MNTKIQAEPLRNVDLAKTPEQTWPIWDAKDVAMKPVQGLPNVFYSRDSEHYFEIRHGDRCWRNGFFNIKDPKALKQLETLSAMVRVLAG